MKCLLLTNDYPPKTGGIQIYLHELWRRLPPARVSVFTRDHPGADDFDQSESYSITRAPDKFLLPTPGLKKRINAHIAELDPDLVLIDPALPLGLLGKQLNRPYGVVLHGAEATIPSQLPVLRQALNYVLKHAEVIISASQWATDIACSPKLLPKTHYVPPGVDIQRFKPFTASQKAQARESLGLPEDALILLSVSRLVPRKGMDDLVKIANRAHQSHRELELVIAGSGRDLPRLKRIAREVQVPVRFLGRISDEDLPKLYGAADIFAMLCRQRWGGLEQEGFGVVFLEAAATGLPQIAGHSGGAAEAVEHDKTGLVVSTTGSLSQRLFGKTISEPGTESGKTNLEHGAESGFDAAGTDFNAALKALLRLVEETSLRRRLGEAARLRAEKQFSYDLLAQRLAKILKL